MLVLDGSQGEGGGQILRTTLALAAVTGTPVRIDNIRAGRPRPGLMRQHLTAVEAAAKVCGGEVSGAAVGSRSLSFRPGRVQPGDYAFSVGTAGSATLVLQTILPGLLTAAAPSTIALEGGTHNPMSPPFDSLAKAFLPLVGRMGPRVGATLERPGFYPAGGGRFRVEITPAPALARLDLVDRGEILRRRATALVANLPRAIAERELATLAHRLPWRASDFAIEQRVDSAGPGFGERGVRAEVVARAAADEAIAYLAADVPVGPHLADQLVLLIALAGSGSFRTVTPTAHTRTQLDVIERFLGPVVSGVEEPSGTWRFQAERR